MFVNFYKNLTSGEPIVYAILAVVIISVIVGYKSAISDILRKIYWRNKK